MSAAGRRGDALAPSLFPFLAVLLCTMGALVLILMLMVAGAQSSAHEVARQAEEEFQWEQEKLVLAKDELTKKYEEAKVELEKKRLVLQNYERHIQELMDELESLELTDQQSSQSPDSRQDVAKERDQLKEALEKQLADAKKKLESALENPQGDKPIFAIIPYEGANGTHRRPIYLECNDRGVVVQPEGVVLTPADLRPPYGPGNPLDAVLRTIRAEFPTKNGAVTNNPYPLLVVRPSGIRHYMLARAAMSGWDDQFGYELVSEKLELAFPPSPPGLEPKIASAIELARQRQAALVMSMPQHYSASQLDSYGSSFGGQGDPGQGISGLGDTGLGDVGSLSWGDSGTNASSAGADGAGQRGGLSMLGPTSPHSGKSGNSSVSGTGSFLPQSGPGGAQTGQNSALAPADAIMPYIGLTESSSLDGAGKQSDSDSLNNSDLASAGAMDGSTGSTGGTADAGSSTNGKASTGSGSGNLKSGSAASAVASESGGVAASFGGGSSSNAATSSTGSTNSISSSESSDPGQAPGAISSLNFDMSQKGNQNVKPVAQTRGRDWAWRDGNRSKTAIVRAIRMQCLIDRWVLLPEKGNQAQPTVILLNGPPIQQAEKLAQVVLNRVDGWGVALAGGHWSPVLHVDVASDAQWRFEQLQRLMEGSGIDVVRKATIASGPSVTR